MKKLLISFVIFSACILTTSIYIGDVYSQNKPFTLQQILNAVDLINKEKGREKKTLSARVIEDIKNRKVDFHLTQENESALRKKGAGESLINIIRANSKPFPAPTYPRNSTIQNSNSVA